MTNVIWAVEASGAGWRGLPEGIEYIYNIFMATTVHIPDDLLTSLDARAKELGISRNRLVVQAVERELRERDTWPPGFIQRLKNVDAETKAAVEEMHKGIIANRRSKPPIEL